MPTDVVLLATTAVLTAVAIGAAVTALLVLRRIRQESAATQAVEPVQTPRTVAPPTDSAPDHHTIVPSVVSGKVVVTPTVHQVVNTALGRPQVRLSILTHGLVYALRTESRDRITALMRREYRRRRAERLRAGRRAARATRFVPVDAQESWLGELPAGRTEGQR